MCIHTHMHISIYWLLRGLNRCQPQHPGAGLEEDALRADAVLYGAVVTWTAIRLTAKLLHLSYCKYGRMELCMCIYIYTDIYIYTYLYICVYIYSRYVCV